MLCGDSKNNIKIWDISKLKIIAQLELKFTNENYNNNNNINDKNNSKSPKNYNVIGLDWNDNNIILATCNTFIFIINFTINKLILNDIINIHSKLYKIVFSPYIQEKQNSTFSVACSDARIRIYEISKIKQSANISPTKILSGHKNSVFGLSYKPINKKDNNQNKYLLASGSDDYKVGIWDLSHKEPKVKFLLGHSDKVRNVVWFKDDNILISGSWDGIAFIWDINYFICLSIINHHKSDIYGIDINNKYPYLFSTSSRDCSISINSYLKNPIKNIFLYKNINENDMIKENHPNLYNQLKNIDNSDNISRAESISNYFLCYPCLKEFYDIIRIILKKSEHSTDNNKIFHITDLYSAYKSKILKIEFDYNNNSNNFNQNEIYKNNIISEAIIKCAAINDWEKFCELNILINNWKKAIMFAPKVSKKYWEDLILRYNNYLKNNRDDKNEEQKNNNINLENNKLIYNILESSINKNIKEPFDLLLNKKEYKNCLLLYIKNFIDKNEKKNNSNNNNIFFDELNEEDKIIELINKIKDNENNEYFVEIMKIINLLVKEKIIENNIIDAICILLSINQIILSIKLLIRFDENELAFYLMDITKNYLYEDIIYINLMKNSLKLNNYKNHISLINICPNEILKIYLYELIIHNSIKLEAKEQKDYENLFNKIKINNNNNNEINILLNLNNNYKDYLPKLINKYFDILLKEIYEENIKYETIKEINEIFNILRIYNLDYKFNNNNNRKDNIFNKLLLIIIFLETLNKNSFCVKLLIHKFLKFSKIEDINELGEDEKIIISLGNDLYKNINNESLFNINFNLHLTLRKDVNLKQIQNNFDKMIKERKLGNVNILNRFSCDLDNKFYFHNSLVRNKIFELNKYIQIIED